MRQTRPGFGPGRTDEVVVLGTGVAHDDDTVDLVPVIGRAGTATLAEVEAVTETSPGGFRTEIVWQDD